MRRLLLALLFFAGLSLPALAQHKPVEVARNADGKTLFADFKTGDLRPDPVPQISINQEVVVDYQCIPNPGLPPAGLDRLYCDSGTGNMTCLTSTGANCLTGSGSGLVTSVGLAGPTGIPISGSPVTSTGTLTFGMPTGWISGDLLGGNGPNSVARIPAPTTPNGVSQPLVSTPSGGVGQPFAPALPGLPGRVVTGTTDTILATDRQPGTVEYRSNANVAVTVPDPGSAGFTTNPAFAVTNEFAGAVTFTPASTAVITYCSGSVCFQNQPTLTLLTGQYARWSSPDNNNWLVFVTNQGQATTCNDVLLTGGGTTWTGGLNFTVSAATYCIAGTTYSSPQTNLTLTTADPTNPRIDVIAVDNTGTAIVITGTPAGSPAAPSVDPTTQLSLTFVTVPAGSSTPTLNTILVYDENVGTPTEWNCTPSSNFNCNSTSNPFHLTHDIEATTAVATNNVVLANSTTVNLSTYSTLSFNIRNKASWPSAKSASICFKNGSTVVGTCIGFKNGVYGFNQANTTGYQQIVIPLSAFALGSTVVDRVVFTVVGGGGSIGFYLDWIQIQSSLSGNGGGTNFQLQVNGANTQPTTNLQNNGSVTFSCTVANSVSTCTATAVGAPPSGTAGGDLSGTYPNPTVAQVNGAVVPASAGVLGSNSSRQLISVTVPTTNQNIREINAVFDGGGSALTGTTTRCRVVNFAGTIQEISILADQSGNATVKVLSVAYASYTGPGSASDISNGGEALSSVVKLQDSTLTSWTTSLSAGTVVCVQVSSPSTLTWLSASIKVAAN